MLFGAWPPCSPSPSAGEALRLQRTAKAMPPTIASDATTTPTAIPALAAEERPAAKSSGLSEPAVPVEVDPAPVALAEDDDSGRLKSVAVTLKQGTWMSKSEASTNVF